MIDRALPADVLASGAIVLGSRVVCDGFIRDYPIRAQSHIHMDHMDDFASSKGKQEILALPGTRDLLICEYNADLAYRTNLIALDERPTEREGVTVQLVSNGHMLGSAQVIVKEGTLTLGYSGDFQWPMQSPIHVDVLVVDSTYGTPASIREFSQQEAELKLLDLMHSRLKRGPVHLKAHPGTLQRAAETLGGEITCPIMVSDRLYYEIEIYKKYGYTVPDIAIAPKNRDEFRERGILLYGRGEKVPEAFHGTKIVLSAFDCDPRDPVMVYSADHYRVAVSGHADFWGTLEYVESTGAKHVICDNARGNGYELAMQLHDRLGIYAVPSTNFESHEWGFGLPGH
jgi:putative mRNA 3-end processing factor